MNTKKTLRQDFALHACKPLGNILMVSAANTSFAHENGSTVDALNAAPRFEGGKWRTPYEAGTFIFITFCTVVDERNGVDTELDAIAVVTRRSRSNTNELWRETTHWVRGKSTRDLTLPFCCSEAIGKIYFAFEKHEDCAQRNTPWVCINVATVEEGVRDALSQFHRHKINDFE